MADYKVRWNYITKNTFTYGSVLQNNEEVSFVNHQMPAGLSIHRWVMTTNFYNDRTSPSLPFLQRGGIYQIRFDYFSVPTDSVYFKMTFYKENDQLLDTLIITERMTEFIYPEEAFYYTIDIMSASVEKLNFKEICISGTELKDISNAMMISDRYINRTRGGS